jgi:hypothetical protein
MQKSGPGSSAPLVTPRETSKPTADLGGLTTDTEDPGLSREEKDKRDHAAYMRRWRAEKKSEPARSTPAAKPGIIDAAPTPSGAPPPMPTVEDVSEKLAHDFVTAFMMLGTDTIHRVKLDPEDPRFGEERAKVSADAIAPYLAPLLKDEDIELLTKALLALGMPTWQLLDWSYEVRAARAARSGLSEPETPTGVPTPLRETRPGGAS